MLFYRACLASAFFHAFLTSTRCLAWKLQVWFHNGHNELHLTICSDLLDSFELFGISTDSTTYSSKLLILAAWRVRWLLLSLFSYRPLHWQAFDRGTLVTLAINDHLVGVFLEKRWRFWAVRWSDVFCCGRLSKVRICDVDAGYSWSASI